MVVTNASEESMDRRQPVAFSAGRRAFEWHAGCNVHGENANDQFWLLDHVFDMHGGPDDN